MKTNMKYIIPVVIVILLLIGVGIYLKTKSGNNNQDSGSVKKGKEVSIEEVVFNMPEYSKESCNEYINTKTKQTNDTKAEKKLNDIIENSKKYTSFASRTEISIGKNDVERFINDENNRQEYFGGGRENWDDLQVTVKGETWLKYNPDSPFKKTELDSEYVEEIKDVIIINKHLEMLVDLENKAVTFDSNSKDDTLLVSGIRHEEIGGKDLPRIEYIVIKFKDNLPTSTQRYSRLTQDAEDSSYCTTVVTTFSNVGDTFKIEKPE
jgi:hypothetical protein